MTAVDVARQHAEVIARVVDEFRQVERKHIERLRSMESLADEAVVQALRDEVKAVAGSRRVIRSAGGVRVAGGPHIRVTRDNEYRASVLAGTTATTRAAPTLRAALRALAEAPLLYAYPSVRRAHDVEIDVVNEMLARFPPDQEESP